MGTRLKSTTLMSLSKPAFIDRLICDEHFPVESLALARVAANHEFHSLAGGKPAPSIGRSASWSKTLIRPKSSAYKCIEGDRLLVKNDEDVLVLFDLQFCLDGSPLEILG